MMSANAAVSMRGLLVVGALAAAFGCTKTASTYCDDDEPCLDPVLSYCDLTGEHGSKNGCTEPPGEGTLSDATPGAPDARTGSPDGSTDSPTDATPADLCAGVDCSALDDACNQGYCVAATGECAAQPINEDMQCADTLCGELGPCGGFSSFCDEVGTAERTCQDLTCQAGACVVGPEYEDEQACERQTDGLTCDDTQNSCTPCGGFANTCDETGTRTCTRTEFECVASSCRSSPTSTEQSCVRQTEGVQCGTRPCNFNQGTQQLCCANQACGVTCGECVTPGAPVFR